jgi:signal transduction histidine kinase
MRAIVPRPETLGALRGYRPAAVNGLARLRRHRLEALWLAFVAVNSAAMFLLPEWETVPFYLIWISLTLLYGLKVWPPRPTLIVLCAVMVLTAIPIATQAMGSDDAVEKVIRVPLMAMLFLAVMWHARRRVEALRIAQSRAEQSRSMLERQERFIHDASHELRTPVTIARGHVELARAASGETAAELDVALDELARMDALIERLLLLATADQTDFVLTREIDLEPFLEDVFMRWSEVAPRAWRLGPLVSGRLWVDPERLRTALDALLENAVKFTHEHDAIGLTARNDRRGGVLIEIDDEGCGVPQEALERIFDRFGRADAARGRSDGGVGLGLAIVDAIAKRHGGRCTVRSTGRGSSFALSLPGFTPAGQGSGQPAAGSADPAPAFCGDDGPVAIRPGAMAEDAAQRAAALSSLST